VDYTASRGDWQAAPKQPLNKVPTYNLVKRRHFTPPLGKLFAMQTGAFRLAGNRRLGQCNRKRIPGHQVTICKSDLGARLHFGGIAPRRAPVRPLLLMPGPWAPQSTIGSEEIVMEKANGVGVVGLSP
jgi:hypothetical protein